MKLRFKAPAYIKQFSCLGADCEDTCCQNWDIHYDKVHYERLAEQVRSEPGERAYFERCVKPLDSDQQSERSFARLQFNDEGFCTYLKTDGLCHIHGKFGARALSNVCALYPRVLSRWGGQIEIAGAMSCPEMVRLCLGSKDGLNEQRVSREILPRGDDYVLARQIDPDTSDDYARSFARVRDTLMQLIDKDAYSIETRLYAMASLAQRLSGFYYRGAQVQSARVENECARILKTEVLETLEDFCSRYEVDEPVAMVVVQSIFQLRLQMAPHEKLAQLIRDIISDYRCDIDTQDGDNGFAFPPLQLWRAYQQKTERVNEFFGAALEEYFRRYVLNCLYREWYVSMPDVFSYVQMLIIRLNLLRFLIMSSPGVAWLATAVSEGGKEPDKEILARLESEVVYIVYNFARSIDHNSPFLQILYEAMAEQQMITFDYSLAFIKG